jgi:hypothetical protein
MKLNFEAYEDNLRCFEAILSLKINLHSYFRVKLVPNCWHCTWMILVSLVVGCPLYLLYMYLV